MIRCLKRAVFICFRKPFFYEFFNATCVRPSRLHPNQIHTWCIYYKTTYKMGKANYLIKFLNDEIIIINDKRINTHRKS